ncbi:hypothetical protein OGM63_02290 [Plectonema radiosum NIES-515]|uniref:Uncharacterized protein n=1 Tax=Plectonema radiosum NIES-515 TaxID=2986073 RepID=A0ABT3ATB8_9CYAN|nr:hypothetical protein [Plectonema radiosum]MCV3212369.1 hypothetical protein [Plectonema radiosum NIES-515]
MNNLSRLLQEIKDNPVVYIDKPSITCLHSFLNGYLDAPIYLGLDREISGFEGFKDWIQERAKTKVCQSWSEIIIFGCGSERSAFYRFFELFEEFKKLKDISKTQEGKEKYSATEKKSRFFDFDIYDEILKGIKKRPGMFLGTSSITKLDMLLRGYSLGRKEVGVPPTKPEREFSGFQSWVQEKYEIKSGQSWAKIILFFSIDDYEALQRFFELYEEYQNRNKSSKFDEKSV